MRSEHLTQLWTVKYAPQTLAQICGNKGLVEKMARWIEAWWVLFCPWSPL